MTSFASKNFNGLRVIVRVDFNVPLNKDFEITDHTRINEALPTLKKILNDGGSLVIMSHLGRPKTGPELKFSLKHLIPYLSKALNREVQFADDCMGEDAKRKSENLKSGDVLLLENLRFYPEEEKGSEEFAQKLSTYGDFYVNDAFGTAHRAHASTAIIAKFYKENKSFGFLMEKEIENISKVTNHPEKPFAAILGGAKISDKLAIIQNLMDKVDYLLIGGGMVFTFVKAQGGKIGNSLCEDNMVNTCRQLLLDAEKTGVKILIPTDVYINNSFANDGDISLVKINEIPDGFMGLDIGPESVTAFAKTLNTCKTILWNGPMGVFEFENFEKGTRDVAYAVANATEGGAFSLVGGGDSVAAVTKFHLSDKVSYVSTGGGAMLEFIEGKILPGISAIQS
jgi:phosphoglycerate kinase